MASLSSIIQIVRAKKIYFINGFLIVLLAVAVAVGKARQNNSGDIAGETAEAPQVHLVAAGDFRADRRAVLASGILESGQQIEIKSQAASPVVRVSVSLGDRVGVGQTLMILENSDLSAQIAQAQAALQIQQVRLQEVKRGARVEERAIAETGLQQAEQGLLHLQKGIYELLKDAYAKVDDAVRVKTDAIFINGETPYVQFAFMVSDMQSESYAKDLRMLMSHELQEWEDELRQLSPGSAPAELEQGLARAIAHLRVANDFFAATVKAVASSAGISTAQADVHKMNVNIGRTSVNGLTSALATYERSLSDQKIMLTRTRGEVNLTETGASKEQVAMQEALVRQAEAGLRVVQTQFQKTVINAPIAGSVASIPVSIGDLVTFGQPLVSLVNTAGLKVKVQVSQEDASLVTVGARAVVNNEVDAAVSERSPSIDPRTKKVEVVVAIADKAPTLLVGQSVDVRITPEAKAMTNGSYLLPIQAVQVSPAGSLVFTVDDDMRARAIPVEIGATAGEFVEVKEGIEDEIKIITTAQDIKDGDTVIVQQ